ncbi:hypothetical protein [Lachnoclostridium sp.]|uniref:hypothetical protein n=1 Tax=Lachnoclostridium sp. TaxID=2028282 RepID=UPI00289773CB|nr:hypothetical protein [Lachnoclostridium sp.]
MIVSMERKITIEELIEEIELQQWEFGCNGFEITECINGKEKKYSLDGLSIDIEDGYIMFYHGENYLEGCFLQMMLSEWIKSVDYDKIDNLIHVTIKTKYGNVYIKAL